ncbi:TrbG/VirB9 family P-type conjugative transfer protein [Qipengyuania oceanensis]|uniref:Type VI secretion protein n=1 Tax=Qipengyuania oceanensis TaxID=1463597 RepID=A0A844YLT3_9SPHN|nr:TrbG/VirB9 family P-type conjugative transfer protein [Qipengyuania oceanensis]MXO63884.1 type VI secretion protein [Qipengyuania oceanensis]
MIRAALITFAPLALLAVASPASAQDSRLVEVAYDEAQVFRLEGRVNVQATIAFADDERIENVAIGDSQSWQITPNKRATLLFVKPLSPSASTNMTVVTDKRTYLFDLVAGPRSKPVYVLRFSYPEEERKAALQLAQGPSAEELAAATAPEQIVDPAELNFAWTTSGDANLLPARSYDNGTATYLSWPAGRAVPAILIKDAKGTEGPVNFTVRGDTIVVDGVPREIVLRSGKDAALLVNAGPARADRPLSSGNKAALAANMESN